MEPALVFAGLPGCAVVPSLCPPVSYGGEFELHALFFYKRTISISLANSDFLRADVSSKMTYAAGAK